AAALWTAHVHKLGYVIKRRASLDLQIDSRGQHHRQLIVGHRNDSALAAMNHRNGSPPVSLSRDSPIAQPVGDRPLAKALLLGEGDHPPIPFLLANSPPSAPI